MLVTVVVSSLLCIFQLGIASDLACSEKGGTCMDYRYQVWPAGYETGLCDGDANRRCRLDCDIACSVQESYGHAGLGRGCRVNGGQCRQNTNYCSGYYSSASGYSCGGFKERQCCILSGSPGSGCYGNIKKANTTGASQATASQDHLHYHGIPASQELAAADFKKMSYYKSVIATAGAALCVDPAVIAGIISRETRAGSALGPTGFGSDGHGYGLMQVDDRYHKLQGGPYSLEHIKQGTGILIDMIKGVKAKHQDWIHSMPLKGGICAYNSGVSNVQTYENMDAGTTGRDYSNDVTARSQWFRDNGY